VPPVTAAVVVDLLGSSRKLDGERPVGDGETPPQFALDSRSCSIRPW
jgi:hypothetical protein